MGRVKRNCKPQLLNRSRNRGVHGSHLPWEATLLRIYHDYEELAASWGMIEGHGDEATAIDETRNRENVFQSGDLRPVGNSMNRSPTLIPVIHLNDNGLFSPATRGNLDLSYRGALMTTF